MMKMNKSLYSLAGILTLVAVGCVKESDMNERFRPEGTPIVFSAATGYENGEATRTEYSGNFFNTSGDPVSDNQIVSTTTAYERIDWKAGDNVKIYYTHGSSSESSVYNVDGITSDAEISDAGVSVAGNNSVLTWTAGNDNHVFTAMYPNVGFDGNNTISFDGETAGGLIPSSQTLRLMNSGNYNGKYLPEMKYAYMLAYKSIASGSSDHDVNLPFRPAFTAFNFRLRMPQTPATGTSGASYKVKSFTMTTLESGASLAGNFSVDIAGLFSADGKDRGAAISNLSVTGGSASITASFVDANHPDGVSLSNTSDLDFTLLALPRNITKVVLTLTYLDADGTEVTKSVQLGGHGSAAATFDACKKYIITNTSAGFDEWEYVLEEIDDITTYGHNPVPGLGFNVMSYKRSKANPSVKRQVAWHIEYKQPGGSYSPSNPNAAFAMSSGSAANGSGSYTVGEDRSVDIVTVNNNYTTEGSGAGIAARAKLASAAPQGSASSPFDLSMHDVHGQSHSQTTANSYVVSAPGYYKFPVVYGNAISNGSDNKSAYDPYGTGSPLNTLWTNHYLQDGVYMTPHFRNALNRDITSPYILTDVSTYIADPEVVIIWQDTATGDEIIKYGANDLQLVGSGNSAYIQFYIDKENIHQGNVLIGLRAKIKSGMGAVRFGRTESSDAGGGTPYNPAKSVLWSWQIWVCEKDLHAITSQNLMPVNLGWVDKSSSAVEKYTNRYNDYRIVQDEPGGTIEDFQILQIGDSREIAANAGGNPFYQWGRKDPITPQNGNRTTQEFTDELNNAGPTYIWTFINSVPFYQIQYDYARFHEADYGRMIRQPWMPLADPVTHSPIQGQFYPPKDFAHTHLDRGQTVNQTEINANAHLHTGSGDADVRQLASSVFNLWNASVWKSADFYGTNGADKYKTVYDPCPPGFCVPTLNTFAGFASASISPIAGEGVNFTVGGETFFMPFSGARVFQGTAGGTNTYEVGAYSETGFYWTDTPSAVMHSTSYDPATGTNNHAGGYFYYQFAKSLRFDSGAVDYAPEDDHWGSEPQSQRVGFDDVRANAFSIRPIVDPKYQ